MSTPQLFRIIVLHGAPKDSHTSTETYLIAADEEEVFMWVNEKKNFGGWTEEDDDGIPTRWDDDAKAELSLPNWVKKNRGDLTDDEGWDDAYYGVTKWGWEPMDASQDDITVLIRLGIAVEAASATKP